MKTPTQDVISTAARLHIGLRSLSEGEADDVHQGVRRQFAPGRGSFLWERFAPEAVREAMYDGPVCQIIRAHLSEDPVLLLIEDTSVFEFSSGNDLAVVLDDGWEWEFSVTNQELDLLLVVSHEQWLYALGHAAAWLKRLKS